MTILRKSLDIRRHSMTDMDKNRIFYRKQPNEEKKFLNTTTSMYHERKKKKSVVSVY